MLFFPVNYLKASLKKILHVVLQVTVFLYLLLCTSE